MHYKTATLVIFVVLMLLTIYNIFSGTLIAMIITCIAVPALTILQVYVVLKAKNITSGHFPGRRYDFD